MSFIKSNGKRAEPSKAKALSRLLVLGLDDVLLPGGGLEKPYKLPWGLYLFVLLPV